MSKQILPCATKVLFDPEKVIKDIKQKRKLTDYFVQTSLFILICTIIYGAVLGTFAGGYQIAINSIKIPLLFFITLFVSLPVFYIIDVLSGSKIDFFQITVLLITGYVVASIIMITFTPVLLFFILTAKEYFFIIFFNTGILGLAGYFSIIHIFKNFQLFHSSKRWYPSMIIGSFIIAFTGTQLAWTLRPFFNTYSEFIRPVEGNFYAAMAKAAAAQAYIAAPILILFGLFTIMLTLLFILKPLSANQVGVINNNNEPQKTVPENSVQLKES